MDPDRWAAMESDGQQQRLSPPAPLSPLLAPPGLLGPAGLQTILLAQLTAQHASQLQYQQALLTWARMMTGGLPPPPPPLLPDPGEPGDRTGPLPGVGVCPSISSGSPPRSDGSPPVRPARKPSGRTAKVFPCLVCGRSFGYKHVLQNHVRTHTGEKPFQCSVCSKRFTRDHHLKTHMRLHTGEKPYQCVHCARRFVQVANLRRHLRVHTGERPYACGQCTARFSDSNQLRTHELVHIGQKLFGCAVCGAEFRRRPQLVQHKCRMPPAGPATAAAGEAPRPRRRRKPSEARRLVRPAHALGGGRPAGLTAGPKTGPKAEVEEVELESGPVIGVSFSLGAGLGTGQGQGLFPTEFGQTEPEDLSVTALQWSYGSLDDQRHSSAELQSPAEVTGDDQKTEEKTSRPRWPSSPAEHGRYDGVGGDALRREQNNAVSVPWWDRRERHSPKSESEESRKPSVAPQDVPVSPWPLHPGKQEQQVVVFPEKQRISVRGWDQLATEGPDGSGMVRTTPDRSRGALRTASDRADSHRRRDDEEPRPAAGHSWPWAQSLADAQRCLPEEDEAGGRQRASISPHDVRVIDCESSGEEEARQKGSPSMPPRHRSSADDRDRAELDGGVTSGRGRKALPPLVPLWIPPLFSAPHPPQEDGRRTEEDTGSALLQLLTAPSSPPPAEYPWSRRRASQGYSGTSERCGDTEEERHRQERKEQHYGEGTNGDYSWDEKEDKHHWEDRDGTDDRKDSVEIEPWEGVQS